jgi:hydroxylysine kinase
MVAISAAPPGLDEATVLAALASDYGLDGHLDPLVSERDQNFRLDCPDGKRYVVKIANAEEPRQTTDLQIKALLHLESTGCTVPVPRIIRTGLGAAATEVGDERHVLRVVSFLPGRPAECVGVNAALAFELGRCLATLDAALADFSHPGESQLLMWDMQRAMQLRGVLAHIEDPELRGMVDRCLDDFEQRALPALPGLRHQVIHNDLNPGNVLVADTGHRSVTGIIDFGDMLRAPLIVDAAIAAAYLRDDDLGGIRALFRGFESLTALESEEAALVYDLVRTRLATTLAILGWRAAAREADDPYLNKVRGEQDAERFLRRLDALGRNRFERRVFGP